MSATVLIVDDEPDLADLYATWLGTEYDVRVANGGEEAIAEMDEAVDVVLLDRLMPDRSGDEVLARLRGRGDDCRVAMVTAVEPDFDTVEMGFDDYLTKPVLEDDLLSTVEALLRRETYDDQVRKFYALASKRAALRTQKSERELAASEAYAELAERMEELRADLDDTASGLSDRDFELAMRQLGADRPGVDDAEGAAGRSVDATDG